MTEEAVPTEGKVGLGASKQRPKSGGGEFKRTPRFTALPADEDKAEWKKAHGSSNDKATKEGKGFKSLIGVLDLSEWLLRSRHYFNRRYRRCLQYQGYCPLCVSEKVPKKARYALDAYLGNIIVVKTDINGVPILDGNKRLVWDVQYTVLGGAKAERISDLAAMYEGSLIGVPIQTTVTNPEFKDWEVQAWSERSSVCKLFVEQFTDEVDGEWSWKPEVVERVVEEGLPEKLWATFLCAEDDAVTLIREHNLEDQFYMLDQLGDSKETHATSSAPSTEGEDYSASFPDASTPITTEGHLLEETNHVEPETAEDVMDML